MASPRHRQLDLLNDWQPPVASVRFDDARVRADGVKAGIGRAVAAALADCGVARAEVARRMSAYLGEDVSKNMLDAYASQAREEHVITLPRFIALLHATGDRRLVEWMIEPLGWSAIDRKHLPLIELAAIQEKQRELAAEADHLRRSARAKGGLR